MKRQFIFIFGAFLSFILSKTFLPIGNFNGNIYPYFDSIVFFFIGVVCVFFLFNSIFEELK